ncbi:MAG: HU family DNA-binding protein [Oscillospiraceae bacterium]|nr:HU family DNA-binding protein [Oscillospiraceae bacterium]
MPLCHANNTRDYYFLNMEETNMNKTELIAAMAEKSELTKKDAEKALAAFLESVEGALKKGDKVQLVGFGTFEVKQRAARTGINPQTKKPVKIAASKAPSFKAGKAFKDALN